jgi:hypothetical protein
VPVRDGSPLTAGAAGDSAATTVSGTVEASTAPGRPAKPGAIWSTIRYSFRRTDDWTEFTLLKVRHLPRGATVRAACRGSRCPHAAVIAAERRTVPLGRFTRRRFAVGTVLTVRISKPGRRTRVTRIAVRRGQDPRITHPRA